MDRWVDPDETDPATWRGSGPHDDLRRGEDVGSVLERAARTPLPYQYEEDRHYSEAVAEIFRTSQFSNARVVYNCGIDAHRRIKVLTRGLLWGGGEDHQRFKAQYRRPPSPTETVPFGEYTVWTRFQYGHIVRTDDGVTFSPGDSAPEEKLETLAWADLYEPVRQRLVELELVRNPPFAKYRLQELDEWEEYRTQFRYDADAFALGP
ncbi:hypothetical protein [Haloarcula sp. JP-L23]|uniref:hypothetical protein n=1 Tax=Haloarcula sp. JP-L23 TaxID=2716717 RepID=UPI00140EFA54|nr:hypothetical protein G9465_08275 [Haloarcula sp. JP-L23]